MSSGGKALERLGRYTLMYKVTTYVAWSEMHGFRDDVKQIFTTLYKVGSKMVGTSGKTTRGKQGGVGHL